MSARAYAAHAEGDSAGASRDVVEALRLYRQSGDQIYVGQVLGNLGYFLAAAGDLDGARRHLAESLDISREFNDRNGIVHGAFNLGLAEYLTGSPEAAAALFAESLDLARRAGMGAQVGYALLGLALAGRCGGDRGWPARLHGAADQALANLGETFESLEARLADQDRQRLRAAMGDEAFEAEYASGRALDPAQVLEASGPTSTATGPPRAVSPAEPATVLTPRELDVLKLVAQGLSNADIARRLVLSEHTVHRHLANILRKLGLSSRAAAAAWGVREGLM